MDTRSRTSLAAVLGTSLLAATGQAQEGAIKDPMQSRFTLNLNDPEQGLPSPEEANKHPLDWGYLLMELDERALAAGKRGDWQSAVKFHRAAAKLTPDRAISFALLCTDYERAGERDKAAEACFQSLNLEGTKLEYFVHYVQLVAARPGGTDAKEVEKALEAIAHLKSAPSGELTGYELQCELSLHTGRESDLRECSAELLKRQPHSPRALSFAWALAVQQKDFSKARKLIRTAKRDGATPSAIAKMEEATTRAERGGASSAVEAPLHEAAPTPPSGGTDGMPPVVAPAASASAAAPESHTDAARSDGTALTAATTGVHPMFRWLLGLVVALALVIPLARRFTSSREA
ncbi:MAG TPA: hypothetical protein VI299_02860 [Polyangiales bacterium]